MGKGKGGQTLRHGSCGRNSSSSITSITGGRNTTSTTTTGFPENCRGIDCNPSCREPCKGSRKRGNRGGHRCKLVQNVWFVLPTGYRKDADNVRPPIRPRGSIARLDHNSGNSKPVKGWEEKRCTKNVPRRAQV